MLKNNLKKMREAKNLSSAELAEMCGIDDSYIRHMEIGSKIPSLSMLLVLAEMLECSTDYLLKGDTDEPTDP
ncbi:MAG: helix-turn-helix domain-containing protein [Oscillospiraceae bacterium]|nr:helix-turn-helix domain-containing protein [Oscillospiraceae bacterium]